VAPFSGSQCTTRETKTSLAQWPLSGYSCIFAFISNEVLAWLSVCSELQMISYGPADATATPLSLASLKSRLV